VKKIGIIGAGPAGLSAAIELSKIFDVTVFEQSNIGENIICAEGFFDYFGTIDVDLPNSFQINKLIVRSKELYEIPLPTKGRFYTFDRKKWQKDLANQAEKKGVKILEKHKVNKDDIKSLSKGFDFLIDATGIKSLSHFLFPEKDVKEYRKNLMPTLQYKIESLPFAYYNAIKVVLYDNPPGYFWIFPKKREGGIYNANVGLGFLSKSSPFPNLKKLLIKTIQEEDISINELSLKTMSSPIPTKRLKTYRVNNIFLLGDALGLCSPLHGGGIDTAYLSGIYLSKAIMSNDFSIFERFLKELDKRFFLERIFVYLWEKYGSHKILSRLKNKGLFTDSPENIPLTGKWFLKAFVRLII